MPRDSEPRNTPEPTITEEAKSEIESNGDLSSDQPTPPEFSDENIESLFESALAIQSSDPGRAMFLYQLVIDIDPDYLNGGIVDFVERQSVETKAHRRNLLREQVDTAKRKGLWKQGEQLARSMLEIDPHNDFAQRQIKIIEKNVECEPTYARAKILKESGNEKALCVLMADIQVACSDYGDPARLLKNQPITRDLLNCLHHTHTLAEHDRPITNVAFSNCGSMLATGDKGGSIIVWSTTTGKRLARLVDHTNVVNSVSFSPNGQYLASASDDGTVILWDCGSWKLAKEIETRYRQYDVAFMPCNEGLIVGNGTDQVQILELPDLTMANSISVRNMPSITPPTISRSSFSTYVRPRNQRTRNTLVRNISLSNAGLLANSVWEHETVRTDSVPLLDTTPVKSVSGSLSTIEIRNTRGWDKHTIESPTVSQEIRRLELSSDGEYYAYLADKLHIRKLPRGRHVHSIDEFESVFDLVFSPIDSSMLLYLDDGPEASRIVFFDLESKQALYNFDVHVDVVRCIAMSPDGRFIATGSDDCTVKIWQL